MPRTNASRAPAVSPDGRECQQRRHQHQRPFAQGGHRSHACAAAADAGTALIDDGAVDLQVVVAQLAIDDGGSIDTMEAQLRADADQLADGAASRNTVRTSE